MGDMVMDCLGRCFKSVSSISYKYGKLGETVSESRTLAVKNGTTGETMTAKMGYQSNYLGQMEQVTYPDGETVGYGYGEDGNRTNKYSSAGETLYFNNLWTWHDAKSIGNGGQNTKNIYLGTERIVSKLNRGGGLDTYSEEYHKTYYWHTDHLGSAHFITDNLLFHSILYLYI